MPSSEPLRLQRRSAREMRRWRCRNTRLRSLPSASRPRAFEPSVWRKKLKARRGRIGERGPLVLRGRNLVIAVSASAGTICDAKQCRHHKDLPAHSRAARTRASNFIPRTSHQASLESSSVRSTSGSRRVEVQERPNPRCMGHRRSDWRELPLR
jgi:hypothetical protein